MTFNVSQNELSVGTIGTESGPHALQCMSAWEGKPRHKNVTSRLDITIFTQRSPITSVSSCLYIVQMSCALLMSMLCVLMRKAYLILTSQESGLLYPMKRVARCTAFSENRGIHLDLQWLF